MSIPAALAAAATISARPCSPTDFVRSSLAAGDRTLSERLVLVLHVAYAFVPLGFLLVGAAAIVPAAVPASAGLHAWTVGAMGLMTLVVMTRATLGHTGRPLAASPATQAIYALMLIAVLLRVAAAFDGSIMLLRRPWRGPARSPASRSHTARC